MHVHSATPPAGGCAASSSRATRRARRRSRRRRVQARQRRTCPPGARLRDAPAPDVSRRRARITVSGTRLWGGDFRLSRAPGVGRCRGRDLPRALAHPPRPQRATRGGTQADLLGLIEATPQAVRPQRPQRRPPGLVALRPVAHAVVPERALPHIARADPPLLAARAVEAALAQVAELEARPRGGRGERARGGNGHGRSQGRGCRCHDGVSCVGFGCMEKGEGHLRTKHLLARERDDFRVYTVRAPGTLLPRREPSAGKWDLNHLPAEGSRLGPPPESSRPQSSRPDTRQPEPPRRTVVCGVRREWREDRASEPGEPINKLERSAP